ncbi:hypothetical protein AB0K18_44765 [Nonomuraea sp. NPDC049421]|uniref:hypothetical protein n=1 Tax=Nonomuraea sp. NPDC049421 TaxID=3155275 RepID=UPI0034231669
MSVPAVPPQRDPSSKQRGWRKLGDNVNTLAGVLAGLLALIGVLAGFWSFIKPDATDAPPASPTGSPATHVPTEPAAVPPTASTSATQQPQQPRTPEVRNRTPQGSPATITRDYGLDLDSTAPNWGVGGYNLDIVHTASGLLHWPGDAVKIDQPGPDHAVCQSATQYYDRWEINTLEVGTQFCARTGERRFSWVELVERGSTYIRVNIVTWEKQ